MFPLNCVTPNKIRDFIFFPNGYDEKYNSCCPACGRDCHDQIRDEYGAIRKALEGLKAEYE
jgi:hypothetical protein